MIKFNESDRKRVTTTIDRLHADLSAGRITAEEFVSLLNNKVDSLYQESQPPSLVWDEGRRAEFADLNTLVYNASILNRSSNFIQNVESCIALADKLSRTNHVIPRASFMRFLESVMKEGADK